MQFDINWITLTYWALKWKYSSEEMQYKMTNRGGFYHHYAVHCNFVQTPLALMEVKPLISKLNHSELN